MNEQASATKSPLFDWVDAETKHIDVVASWENMYLTYDTLRFSDRLADDERLEEFKWITHNMNIFLTKMRNKLLTCQNKDAMVEVLRRCLYPTGKVDLSDRKSLAFQKLRQQWIVSTIAKLNMMSEETEERNN